MPNLGPYEFLLVAAIFGAATALIFSRKGQGGWFGFGVGFVLGPIGVAIGLMLDPPPPRFPET